MVGCGWGRYADVGVGGVLGLKVRMVHGGGDAVACIFEVMVDDGIGLCDIRGLIIRLVYDGGDVVECMFTVLVDGVACLWWDTYASAM